MQKANAGFFKPIAIFVRRASNSEKRILIFKTCNTSTKREKLSLALKAVTKVSWAFDVICLGLKKCLPP